MFCTNREKRRIGFQILIGILIASKSSTRAVKVWCWQYREGKKSQVVSPGILAFCSDLLEIETPRLMNTCLTLLYHKI
jgi:hypothetical protein